MARESWQRGSGATQSSKEQNTFNPQRIKNCKPKKDRRRQRLWRKPRRGSGRGRRAPAPMGAGLSTSVLYRVWPWALGLPQDKARL